MTALLLPALAVLAGVALTWLRRRLRIVTIDGDSMRPALHPGDQMLVRRAPLTRVRVGDIVVFAPPRPEVPEPDPTEQVIAELPVEQWWVIKRVVAVAGDPVPATVATAVGASSDTPVPDGALVVIGDNRDSSFDSRSFGYVWADAVLGVVVRRIRMQVLAAPRTRSA